MSFLQGGVMSVVVSWCRELGRFGLAGGLATAVHLGAMALAIAAGAPPLAATVGGAVLGALVNYALQYGYTFAARIPHARALRRYALVTTAGWALNAAAFQALHAGARLDVAPAQILTTGLLALTNFLFYRSVVFHE